MSRECHGLGLGPIKKRRLPSIPRGTAMTSGCTRSGARPASTAIARPHRHATRMARRASPHVPVRTCTAWRVGRATAARPSGTCTADVGLQYRGAGDAIPSRTPDLAGPLHRHVGKQGNNFIMDIPPAC